MFEVRFYGKLRQVFGDKATIAEPITTITELIAYLASQDESITRLKPYLLFSKNQKQATLPDTIEDGDEIAVFITPTGG